MACSPVTDAKSGAATAITRSVATQIERGKSLATVAGRGECVPLDLRGVTEYDASVELHGKAALRAAQFLKLPPGEIILVYVRGVDAAKVCKSNGIPYRRVKGLFALVNSAFISSSRNAVAVRKAHLPRLKNGIKKRSVVLGRYMKVVSNVYLTERE